MLLVQKKSSFQPFLRCAGDGAAAEEGDLLPSG
jgi:hypothetical protein